MTQSTIQAAYPYTMDDLSSACGVTKQSIYNLIRNNKQFIDDNSRRYQRKIHYSHAVMAYFTEYYDKPTPQPPKDKATLQQERKDNETLTAEVKTLQAEVESLKQLLEGKEAERKELLKQNGALILTLQQEKQEKQLLLPAPRKPLGDRIKGWFRRDG